MNDMDINPTLYQPLDWDDIDRQLGLIPPTVCVLVATKNGQDVVEETIRHALPQADVFLVSDGSTDNTAQVAIDAGARVLDLDVNAGKPAALRKGFHHFKLEDYDYILVLDDDTRLAPDFVKEALLVYGKHPEAVAVSGKTLSDWRHEQRWNGWIAGRAMGYARYDLFVKKAQSALRCVTVLPGSNTMFRTGVFGGLVAQECPYVVDDSYWLLEIQTKNLGRIVHTSYAKAYVQDPTTLRDYYKQMLRWMWGSFQGVRGHKIGRRLSWFSFTYAMLILDWILYVTLWPAFLAFVGWRSYQNDNLTTFVLLYLGGYFAWCCLFAIGLRKWRLPLLTPWVIAMDWINRAIFIHAFFKTWRRPTVETCIWDSPERFKTSA